MKILLKVLNISNSDIARRAGVSPAAVTVSLRRRSGRGYETARAALEEARFGAETADRVTAAIEELKNYQLGVTP